MENVEYLNNLINDCQKAKNAVLDEQYVLKKEMDINDIKKIKSGIYIIRELNGDSDKTSESFINFKNENKDLKCPKFNGIPSETLYVGSSTTGLLKRLKQHIEQCHKDTYALRLNDWFTGEYEIEIRVYHGIERNVLQLIEDNLAFNLSPAFGKRGSNNK